MDKITKKQMEEQVLKVQNLAWEHREEHAKLDNMMNTYYGSIHYSDRDVDELIDALDYGTSTTDFFEFNLHMKEINKK